MEWIEKLTNQVKWSKKGSLSLKNSLPDDVPVPVQFYLSSIRPHDMANALAYIKEGATHYFAQGYVGIVFYGDIDDAWLSSSGSELSEDESTDRSSESSDKTIDNAPDNNSQSTSQPSVETKKGLPLQPDEVGFCVGNKRRAKYKMLEKDFLKVMKKLSDKTSDNAPDNDSQITSQPFVETEKELPLQPGEVGFCVGNKRRAKYKMLEKDFLKVMKKLLIMRQEQNHEDIPGQQEFLDYVDEELHGNEEKDEHQLGNVYSYRTEELN
ncbi:Hypp9503 [Branchiostoma lanceolatum]|uniref:Hypp9503 protein n=1 Tax=Branchiostoma lanceolatum TaxID=7740 RepID=A0A8S4MMR6_BRALA|nr:Hypp9503 [Branchiostoma lanceolatum]